jgi:histidinol-phosphatase (PHP family)
MIERRLYDVLGHLELIRKFDRLDENGVSALFGTVESIYDEEVDLTLAAAAEAGIIVEYNTGGQDALLGRPYLSDRAVERCVALGIRVALSSDAHRPTQVARHFDASVARLRSLGVRELWGVRDGQPLSTPI